MDHLEPTPPEIFTASQIFPRFNDSWPSAELKGRRGLVVIEPSVALPDLADGRILAQVTLFSILQGSHDLSIAASFKAQDGKAAKR
jgi:hypothetical protein